MSGISQYQGDEEVPRMEEQAPVPLLRPADGGIPLQRPRQTRIFALPTADAAPSLITPPPMPHMRRTQVFSNPPQPRRTQVFPVVTDHPQTLSARLREGTVTELTRAKTSAFLSDLIEGKVSRERYCLYLSCILEIYHALESALTLHRSNPVLAPFYWPELFRVDSIRLDLEFFLHGRASEDVSEIAPVRAWVQRIESISEEAPELLIAYAYVRYMRDLAGWPQIGERTARCFRLTFDSSGNVTRGLAFHQFPDIPDVPEARARFRALLDAVPADEVDYDDVLREARRAFTMNYALVLELT